jgi:hypothetical protein
MKEKNKNVFCWPVVEDVDEIDVRTVMCRTVAPDLLPPAPRSRQHVFCLDNIEYDRLCALYQLM